MQEQNLIDQLTEDGTINTEEARDIIEKFGSDKLKEFMNAMKSGQKMRLGHEGKHNVARAERAKSRIAHRKAIRKRR